MLTWDTLCTIAGGIIRLGDTVTSPLYDPDMTGWLADRARVFVAIPRIAVDPLYLLTSSVATPPGLLVARWQIIVPAGDPRRWHLKAGRLFLYDDGGFTLSIRTDTLLLAEGQGLRDALSERRRAARAEERHDEVAEAMLGLYDTASTPGYRNVPWGDAFWNFVAGKETRLVVFGWEMAEALFVPGRGLEPVPRKGGTGG